MPAEAHIYDFTIGCGSDQGSPSNVVGMIISGSSDVMVNSLATARGLADYTVHILPPGGTGMLLDGSSDVQSNEYKNHREGDDVNDFIGYGITSTGSPDTYDN